METDQPEISRITWKKIGADLLAQLQLERGLLRTVKELFLQPGAMVRSVLFTADRDRYVKPLSYLLLTTALATFLFLQFGNIDKHFQESFMEGFRYGYESSSGGDAPDPELQEFAREAQLKISYVATKYFNLLILLALPIYALCSFILFRREKLFYPEHLVANMYIMGTQNVLFFPLAPVLYSIKSLSLLYIVVSLGYQGWVYYQLFTSYSRGSRLLRTLFCILACIMAYFIVVLLGALVVIRLLPIDLPA